MKSSLCQESCEQIDVICLENWNQKQSLKPPPFTGPMKRILRGLDIGDKRIDALPISAVCCHGGKARKIGLDPVPAWVDWESVRRGQKLFMARVGQHYAVLTLALLQGFSIARFAEVLHANGYAQSGETAFERYRETSFAILDWMRHPLDDPNSKACEQLENVRAMHSYARRRATKLFNKENGEGIALSQYDMAEVLLGFAGITPNILEKDLKINLPRKEKEDLSHVWRYIGYQLGIEDEFNVCNSLDDLEAIVEEYMIYTPRRFETCRPCTYELQRTALEGLGLYTGVGVEFFSGMLHYSCTLRDLGTDYLERPCHPGMKIMGEYFLKSIASDVVNFAQSKGVVRMRDAWIDNPQRQRTLQPWLASLARLNDSVLWRFVASFAWNSHLFFSSPIRKFLFTYLLGIASAHSLRRLSQKLGLL